MKRILHLERQFDSMDALQALKQGLKVRFTYWPSDHYIEYTKNSEMKAHPETLSEYLERNPMRLIEMLTDWCYTSGWELYVEENTGDRN